jgi:threonine/homoserine/homoserine lactone efflux protein
MPLGILTAFWALSLLLVLVPGTDWAYVIAAGLRDRSILPAVGGLLLGYLALTLVVAAGVAAPVARLPGMLTALTVAGALYLLRLRIATTIHPPSSTPEAGDEPAAAGISGLNPKALLVPRPPAAVRRTRQRWPFAAQTVVLGLVHTANCAVVYVTVGATARRALRTRPAVARTVTRCSGIAMITIGALLLAERLVAIA